MPPRGAVADEDALPHKRHHDLPQRADAVVVKAGRENRLDVLRVARDEDPQAQDGEAERVHGQSVELAARVFDRGVGFAGFVEGPDQPEAEVRVPCWPGAGGQAVVAARGAVVVELCAEEVEEMVGEVEDEKEKEEFEGVGEGGEGVGGEHVEAGESTVMGRAGAGAGGVEWDGSWLRRQKRSWDEHGWFYTWSVGGRIMVA